MYEDELEGQRVYALVGVKGTLVCVQTMVEDGVVKMTLDDIGMGLTYKDQMYSQVVLVSEDTFLEMYAAGMIPEKSMRDSRGRRINMGEFNTAMGIEGPLS